MPPTLQLIDWDFVSDEGLHWEVRGTVLLFPGREEGLMRALVVVGEGREVNRGGGASTDGPEETLRQPPNPAQGHLCLRALQTCWPREGTDCLICLRKQGFVHPGLSSDIVPE